MLSKHLHVPYFMMWSIAIANILGSGLCFAFSGFLAKLATLRYTLIMRCTLIIPCVLILIYGLGRTAMLPFFATTDAPRPVAIAPQNWGDLYSLMFFGMLGWVMKHYRWSRTPLVLGFVLGVPFERYMFISIERYGIEWMWRPIVIVMFILSALTLMRPVLQGIREHGIKEMLTSLGAPKWSPDNVFPAAMICLFIVMLATSVSWQFEAKIIPTIVGIGAVMACSLSLANDIFNKRAREPMVGVTA
jgi:hypothetical protein